MSTYPFIIVTTYPISSYHLYLPPSPNFFPPSLPVTFSPITSYPRSTWLCPSTAFAPTAAVSGASPSKTASASSAASITTKSESNVTVAAAGDTARSLEPTDFSASKIRIIDGFSKDSKMNNSITTRSGSRPAPAARAKAAVTASS